jgi:hypothetical protein
MSKAASSAAAGGAARGGLGGSLKKAFQSKIKKSIVNKTIGGGQKKSII